MKTTQNDLFNIGVVIKQVKQVFFCIILTLHKLTELKHRRNIRLLKYFSLYTNHVNVVVKACPKVN